MSTDTTRTGEAAAGRCVVAVVPVAGEADFPPERWMADLEKTEIRDSVKPDIMLHNAARLFGLEKDGS